MVKRAVLDTNIFIDGFADIRKGTDLAEARILKYLMKKEIVLVFSDKLEEQIMMVAKRLVNKDYAGLLRYFIWISFNVDYVQVPKQREVIKKYEDIPRKDLLIFLTARFGNADYLISNNRAFLKKARGSRFECLTPEDFLKRMEEKHLKASNAMSKMGLR